LNLLHIMKKLIWIVSVLLVPAIAKTQHFSASFKISMNPPEIIDVVLILDDATLGFNRQDIIEAFQKFKKDYELKQYELTNFEEAVAMLEKQKEKIKVDDVKTQKSEHVFLSQLLYMRVAANLLLAGKAEVIRKSSKEPEIEITWRQLLPGLNEGSLYKFSFTDGQENASTVSRSTMITEALNSGIPVFTVTLLNSGGAGADDMKNIADTTGGFAFTIDPDSCSNITNIYAQINNQFNNAYKMSISWPANEMPPSGTSVTVTITVTTQGITKSFDKTYLIP